MLFRKKDSGFIWGIHATPSIQNSTRISPQAVQMADFMVLQIKVKWTKSIKFEVKRLKKQRATERKEYLSLQTRGIANLEYLQDKERWPANACDSVST